MFLKQARTVRARRASSAASGRNTACQAAGYGDGRWSSKGCCNRPSTTGRSTKARRTGHFFRSLRNSPCGLGQSSAAPETPHTPRRPHWFSDAEKIISFVIGDVPMNMRLTQAPIDTLCANALRFLAIDAVEAAKSGHPGMPMGMAEIAVALWTRHLKHDPADPLETRYRRQRRSCCDTACPPVASRSVSGAARRRHRRRARSRAGAARPAADASPRLALRRWCYASAQRRRALPAIRI